jgi:RIO kinase 2
MADSGQFAFIDWPQSIPASDPNASELLTRDISNVVKFFARRYNVFVPVQDALDYIRGKKKGLTRMKIGKLCA